MEWERVKARSAFLENQCPDPEKLPLLIPTEDAENMAKKSEGGVVAAVRAAVTPVIVSLGYSVWDIEYVKEGAERYLRVTIDAQAGITIDDCEKVHRAIDPVLDELDPIEEAYHLEVSSPGLERELRTDEHLAACVGEEVEVRLYAPADGAKVWNGTLLPADGSDAIRIAVGETERAFPRASVAAVRTVYRFDDEA